MYDEGLVQTARGKRQAVANQQRDFWKRRRKYLFGDWLPLNVCRLLHAVRISPKYIIAIVVQRKIIDYVYMPTLVGYSNTVTKLANHNYFIFQRNL